MLRADIRRLRATVLPQARATADKVGIAAIGQSRYCHHKNMLTYNRKNE